MPLRIAAVSVAPIFPDVVYGGSQAVLTQVASGLGQAGHHVDLVCSARAENEGGFQLAQNVAVRPLLRLTGAFPDPYEVHPARLARSAREIQPLLSAADIVYLHADIFHLRGLIPDGVRVVRSFHDFHYETALVSVFAYTADLTIVPSRYLANCISATVGRSGVRTLESIRVIPNGVDTSCFNPEHPATFTGVAPKDQDDLVLLYPHRPDERKGIFQALEVVARLKVATPNRNIRLLVPRHIDADRLPFMREQYELVDARAMELSVNEELEFVPWISRDEMPGFFRYGDVTLAIGNFIEAFGLTPYESIACGTPVVTTNVGAYRESPDLAGIERVDYGDIDSAARVVLDLVDVSPDSLPQDYESRRMIEAYVEAITGTPIDGHLKGAGDEQAIRLAPWCYSNGDRIYDDYAYGFHDLPGLAKAVVDESGERPYASGDLEARGVSRAEIEAALERSVLVQDFPRF